MKEVDVYVKKYEAKDGSLFNNKKDCELYEKKLDGKIKKCDNCNGSGEVDPYGDGRVFKTCGRCGGKGYLELKEQWV